MKTTKKVIESGLFTKKNAAKYLTKSGFPASESDFNKAENEKGYFERFSSSKGEAYAGFIAEDKIQIDITNY